MNKSYILYDKISGEIFSTGFCAEKDFNLQKIDGKEILEGCANSQEAYIKNNKIVYYTEQQKQNKLNGNVFFAVWSNETFEWIDQRQQTQKYNDNVIQVDVKRKKLLDETDWRVIKALESQTNLQQNWIDYRQALRDITTQSGYPDNVIWPTPPQG